MPKATELQSCDAARPSA